MTNPKSVSRRELLRTSASVLLAANLWPGALRAADVDSGEFSMIIVNDLHYVDEKCQPYFEKVIASMKAAKQKIDLCIIAGDLTDGGTTDQASSIRDLFKTLGAPIHVVCGNHDFKADDDRKAFEELFPKSLNYTFEHNDWQFVGLDSTQGMRADAKIQDATFAFLDDAVPHLDKKRPILLFTHFPLGPKVNYRPPNADELLARFKDFNLRAVYGGHYHAFSERTIGEIVLTGNRCCSFRRNNHDGTKEKGYFICRTKDGKIEREFVEVPVA